MTMNPEQLSKEFLEMSSKLLNGVDQLGQLEVNEDCYTTDKEIVYQEDKLTLYRFKSTNKKTIKMPLLICYALVNRPYMTDLQPDRSLVDKLLKQGVDVYLIDWGYPDASDRCLTLDDYINGYLHNCIDFICDKHKLPSINLLGICQGGTFGLCYAALHPGKINGLITMVTPVDFQTKDNLLSHWVQNIDVDLLVNTLGNVPGELLNWCYLSLKPYRLGSQKYVGLVDILDNKAQLENFMRMERWIFDSPDQVGETFRQFTKDCYQRNKLIKGKLNIGDQIVNLKNIKAPVLNIYAKQDHLVPPSASMVLKKYLAHKNYTELAFSGGHIGIYVSGRAQREVPAAIVGWLQKLTN